MQTLLEVRWETIRPFLVSTEYWDPIHFQEESDLRPFRNTELRGPLEVSNDVRLTV